MLELEYYDDFNFKHKLTYRGREVTKIIEEDRNYITIEYIDSDDNYIRKTVNKIHPALKYKCNKIL